MSSETQYLGATSHEQKGITATSKKASRPLLTWRGGTRRRWSRRRSCRWRGHTM